MGKSLQRLNIQPAVPVSIINQNDLPQRQIEASSSESTDFSQKLQDQEKGRHMNLRPILTVVVNQSVSDLFATDSILNHTVGQQDQQEHPSLHLTVVYGDYQPNNISVDPQNNISVGIPSDLQSERQEQPAEESKMANDIGQFFDNTVNKYFPNTPLNNDSIDDNESDSIDDNESNEIFDQTSQSAKPMLDSPGDVGNKFINSHLPKDLVLDGKVEDVINNQVLKMSNDINPTGNKSSVIPSKRLNQNEDQSQKSQIREKVLQGKSGHAKEKIPVLDKQVLPSHLSTVVNPTENKTSLSPLQKQKEKPVLNNQVASHNKTFSNVSKSQSQNKDQIQKLVVKQKKERGLEQEKESDLEKEEKKLEQREKEQEKLEELLHQREEILEKKENEQKIKQQNQQKKEIELLKRKQEVLKKQQELKERNNERKRSKKSWKNF